MADQVVMLILRRNFPRMNDDTFKQIGYIIYNIIFFKYIIFQVQYYIVGNHWHISKQITCHLLLTKSYCAISNEKNTKRIKKEGEVYSLIFKKRTLYK